MWVLLSSRIRSWLLLAVAVPAARRALQHARHRAEDEHPDARTVGALRTAERVLARVDRREKWRARTEHRCGALRAVLSCRARPRTAAMPAEPVTADRVRGDRGRAA